MYADRLKKIDMSIIRNYSNLQNKWNDCINLTIGQPDFFIPDKIKKYAIKSIRANDNKYSDSAGISELRYRIAEKYKSYGFSNISNKNVLITSGTTAALTLSLFAILNPGDEIIIPDPYYNEYKYIPEIIGAKIKYIDTYPDFEYTAKKIAKEITSKTKAIIINNPSNPTGKVINSKEMIEIINLTMKQNLYIIIDEIYEEFIYDSCFEHYGKFYDKAITISGFSKSYSMTGWRVGYIVSLDDKFILNTTKLQQYMYICAPTPFQKAACHAIDRGFENTIRDEYRTKRDIAYSVLNKKFDVIKPEGSFYIFPSVNGMTATEFCNMVAQKTHVLIVPGKAFSNNDTNFRVSFACDNKKLQLGCQKICSCI